MKHIPSIIISEFRRFSGSCSYESMSLFFCDQSSSCIWTWISRWHMINRSVHSIRHTSRKVVVFAYMLRFYRFSLLWNGEELLQQASGCLIRPYRQIMSDNWAKMWAEREDPQVPHSSSVPMGTHTTLCGMGYWHVGRPICTCILMFNKYFIRFDVNWSEWAKVNNNK